MKRQITLDYTLQFGVLAQYAAAVRKGLALASACNKCGFTAFPPRVTCLQCESGEFRWRQLTGEAQLVERTGSGSEGYALAHFDGAQTQSVVRLHDISETASRGRLIAPQDELIGLWLGAEAFEARKED